MHRMTNTDQKRYWCQAYLHSVLGVKELFRLVGAERCLGTRASFWTALTQLQEHRQRAWHRHRHRSGQVNEGLHGQAEFNLMRAGRTGVCFSFSGTLGLFGMFTLQATWKWGFCRCGAFHGEIIVSVWALELGVMGKAWVKRRAFRKIRVGRRSRLAGNMGGQVDLLTALWCESGFLAEAETGRGVRGHGRRGTCAGHRAGRAAAVCTQNNLIIFRKTNSGGDNCWDNLMNKLPGINKFLILGHALFYTGPHHTVFHFFYNYH